MTQAPAAEPQVADAGRVAFRIRIGVTGHRQLQDEAAIRSAVRAWLDALRRWFPPTDSTTVTFSFISALAEGADRLVVDEGMATFDDADPQLEVVLPLKHAEYERDFTDGGSVDAFRRYLDRAASKVTVRKVDDRNHAYLRAGQHVVDRCDALIAVWDGGPAHGRGGTKEIMSYAQDERVPVLIVRTDAAAATATPPIDRPAEFDELQREFNRLEEYNSLSFATPALRAQLDREMRAFETVAQGPIHWACEAAANWALPHFVRADYLAVKYQRQYNGLGETLFSMSALAGAAVAAQVVFLPKQPGWGWIEVGLMFLLLAGVAFGRRAQVHDRWLAHRSLAEAFRAAPFLALTGLGDGAGDGTTGRRDSQQWFQRAFSEAWQSRPKDDLRMVAKKHPRELSRVLAEAWLLGQVRYHESAVRRYDVSYRRMTIGIQTLFGATLIVGLLHVSGVVDDETATHKVLEFVAITMPAFGAALSGIRDQGQYLLHRARSTRTAGRIERLRRAMVTEHSPNVIQRLALEAQSTMAADNVDWSSVVEFQNVEIVA